MTRLKSKHAHAESPHSRTRRFVTNVRVEQDGPHVVVHANFHVMRTRLGKLDHFLGAYRYVLVAAGVGIPGAGARRVSRPRDRRGGRHRLDHPLGGGRARSAHARRPAADAVPRPAGGGGRAVGPARTSRGHRRRPGRREGVPHRPAGGLGSRPPPCGRRGGRRDGTAPLRDARAVRGLGPTRRRSRLRPRLQRVAGRRRSRGTTASTPGSGSYRWAIRTLPPCCSPRSRPPGWSGSRCPRNRPPPPCTPPAWAGFLDEAARLGLLVFVHAVGGAAAADLRPPDGGQRGPVPRQHRHGGRWADRDRCDRGPSGAAAAGQPRRWFADHRAAPDRLPPRCHAGTAAS